MNIATRSLSRLIRDDVHVKANRRSTGHLLSTRLKQIGKLHINKFSLLKKFLIIKMTKSTQ